MPETKIQITMNDQVVEAVDVPILQSNEVWSEYKLEDGTMLRVKLVVGSIIRLIGQCDPEGNPVYLSKGTVVSIPIVPDSLRQKK